MMGARLKRGWRVFARALRVPFVILAALLAVVLVNTLRKGKAAIPVVAAPPRDDVDAARVAQHLADVIRFATVSHEQAKDDDPRTFEQLRGYLEATYPKLHSTLTREIVGGDSLVYVWRGSDASRAPALLAAHMDVVPVEPGTEAKWSHPPFAGDIDGGFIWGRGALDDKGSLVAILEAVEALATQGFTPKRTLYLAFGADEEVSGRRGAAKIAETFAAKGLHFDYVLDEGGIVADGIVPDLPPPIALIGVTEKGYVSVDLTVEEKTGHSSMPPDHTAIGVLAAAVERLEKEQMPARLTDSTRSMFESIAPEMPFGRRVVMSNVWLFEPLLVSMMTKQPPTASAVRTTTAVTIIEGGVKENVLPSRARAVVNFRVLPGDTTDDVVAHVRAAVADPRVTVEARTGMRSEPPPPASTDTRAYRLLETTVRQFFPGALVAPNVVGGATDARHYTALAGGVYHFSPFVMRPPDLPTIHGTNERCGVEPLATAVRFYLQLVRAGD